MNSKQIDALVSCMKENGIKPNDLCEFLNKINPGDFHFTDGSHFPYLLPGLTANGVFASPEYYLTEYERTKGKTTKGRAKNFCSNRGTVLPDSCATVNMRIHVDKINASLRAIGFPLLQKEQYWAKDDEEGEGEAPEIRQIGIGVGDTEIYGGYYKSYRKYVRGCIKVVKSNKATLHEDDKNTNSPDLMLDKILHSMKITRHQFDDYLRCKKTLPQAGDYLLKGGEVSRSTVYNMEAGIFANPNLYIRLDMPAKRMSAQEVNIFCKMSEVQAPEFFDLRQIEKAAPQINKALEAVGMAAFALPENLHETCWCQESLNAAHQEEDADTKKRLLLFGKQKNVDEKFIFIEDILWHLSLE